jgi:hypothetical protein
MPPVPPPPVSGGHTRAAHEIFRSRPCEYEDRFDGDDFDFDNGSGIGQEFEQESESGDVDQSFTVTSEGDNSNQCVGI